MDKIEQVAAQVAGWWYAEACTLMDKNEDIRTKEVPEMMSRMKRDLSQEPIPIEFDKK